MNCHKCGEEIGSAENRIASICESCFDEFIDPKLTNEEIKTNVPLDPRKAIRFLLLGEMLFTPEGAKVAWSDEEKTFVTNGNQPYYGFGRLFYKPQKNQVQMTTIECLAWVNSPESHGWLVRCKWVSDNIWQSWDIPQRFLYDTQEKFADPGVISYQRARILPDKSGIDETTIQGFLKEVKSAWDY